MNDSHGNGHPGSGAGNAGSNIDKDTGDIGNGAGDGRTKTYLTAGGIGITRTARIENPRRRDRPRSPGARRAPRRAAHLVVRVSGTLQTRWDIGFCDPALAFTGRRRGFEVRACNERGATLLPGRRDGAPRLRCGHGPGDGLARRGRDGAGLRGVVPRGAAQQAADPVLGGARAHRPLPQPRGRPSRALRRIRLRARVPVRPDPARDCRATRTSATSCSCCPTTSWSWTTGARPRCANRYEFETGGRRTAGLPPHRLPDALRARRRGRAGMRPRPGEYAATVRAAIEAFRRGDLFEVVPGQTLLRALRRAAVGSLPTAEGAEPCPYGALMHLGEREYLVAGLAGDVRAGRGPAHRDLPDLGHHRAGRERESATRARSVRC